MHAEDYCNSARTPYRRFLGGWYKDGGLLSRCVAQFRSSLAADCHAWRMIRRWMGRERGWRQASFSSFSRVDTVCRSHCWIHTAICAEGLDGYLQES